MGAVIERNHKYAAFISYAHADEAAARKLHNALETYPLPKDMDQSRRARLSPIFRDVTELTAHHSLSEKIRDAVKTSSFLIVLCSPTAKASHWVNEEIRLFRSLHGEGAILAVIVDGVPDTAFPPALLEDGREPLAADISGKEGFKFGVTQLAASMLGVGLDTLVQRDQRRRRIRTQAISAASTALALIMGTLAWNAVDARDEAEVSRNEAEKMVEFMIKDLKEDLVPIQKLDLFDNVGKRVTEYYDAIPLSDMDDDRLMRQARARHILGEVAINQGDFEKAEKELSAAYEASKQVLDNNSDNTNAIFTHAQSEYWMGWVLFKQRKFVQVLPFFERYNRYGQKLLRLTPQSYDTMMEAAWGKANLGLIHLRLENLEKSQLEYESAISLFENTIAEYPDNLGTHTELANALAGAAQIAHKLGRLTQAKQFRKREVEIFRKLFEGYPDNYHWKYRLHQSEFRF